MTAINEAVTSSVSAIREINENIARLKEEAKAARSAAIDPFLNVIAESGEVSLIVVRGSTPGFNDGEPCEHSADLFVNVKRAKEDELYDGYLGFELPSELIDGLKDEVSYEKPSYRRVINEGALAHNEALCREHGHVYAEPSAEIMSAITDVIFDTVEEENGTNYYVSFVLIEGKFVKFSGEYDCGY
ncbi:hypothetical protein CPJ18_02385 [Agrobacterium rosae]|uniref:Uncharacterized protein n=1 Tax=Agrobacterium rosae TaxID=1972867 RepID=A0AAE5S2C5_9HYPH|nr:hypothetical protein [Agrobacterium rosae]POO54365.1 hypothetical protein CPJ18_02385 [Agrobacterium rosae]